MDTNPFFSTDTQDTEGISTNPFFSSESPTTNTLDSYIGEQNDNGMCQRFVEKVTYGKTGMFPSAVGAWDSYVNNGQARSGFEGIKPGDIIYFAPDNSNGGYGHTGIYTGEGNFVSATYNGVEKNSLSDWIKKTGQQYLGYVHP